MKLASDLYPHSASIETLRNPLYVATALNIDQDYKLAFISPNGRTYYPVDTPKPVLMLIE